MDDAALYGHLDIIQFLHQNRSEGCDRAIVKAAINGHFSVVKYLVENLLGTDFIQEAIDYPISFYYSDEKKAKSQEIKNYLQSFLK